MRTRQVVFSPEAQADLLSIYDYIAGRSSPTTAAKYLARIEAYCLGLKNASERGTRRDDVRPNLRLLGFERRVAIAFHLDDATVTIDRVLYAGRDLRGAFSKT